MALTPTTLQTLITEVRLHTNTENNQIVTDTEITGYLNNGLAILDAILVSKFSDYKITKTLVSCNGTTNIISLPADFLKLRGLDCWAAPTASDGYITMTEYGWDERNKKIYPTGGNQIWTPYDLQYRLEDQRLTILPIQIAPNYQYRLNYTPDYIPLVNTTDTLQSYMDTQLWRQYGVFEASADVLAKQDLDASFFMTKAEQLREHLIQLATPNRNADAPKGVGTGDRSYYGYPFPLDW